MTAATSLRMTAGTFAEATIQQLSYSLVLLATMAAHAIAQAPVPAGAVVPRTIGVDLRGFWIELGAGVGKALNAQGGADVSASVDWQQGSRLWSVRGDGVSTGWSSGVGQVALMLGRATTTSGHQFGAASAGIAFAQTSVCLSNCGLFSSGNALQETHNTVGAAVALKGALRAGGRGGVGIGATAFGNVNSESSFMGIAVTLSGGRWR